ncbi:MarR family winged helix-turn-helix transcriptional regulator [Thermodesulfobacteriota bacterium]
MAQFEDCIVFLLAKAYQKAHGEFKKRIQRFGLTPIQHLILEVLWEEEGLSAKDIAKKLVLDNATLSGVLDRMMTGNWILKETDPEDKRLLRINLSDEAKRLKPTLLAERKQINDEILSQLTVEEKIVLKRLLRDVQG